MKPINEGVYINLNLLSNKLGVGLCDFERTGKKPDYIEPLCNTLKELLDKFLNWNIEPKYSSFVNNLLNTEEEYYLLRGCLGGEEYEEAKSISQKLEEIRRADKITTPIKKSIDYLVDFLTKMSDESLLVYLK